MNFRIFIGLCLLAIVGGVASSHTASATDYGPTTTSTVPADPCRYNGNIPADDPECPPPCEYNPELAADDPYCEPEPTSTTTTTLAPTTSLSPATSSPGTTTTASSEPTGGTDTTTDPSTSTTSPPATSSPSGPTTSSPSPRLPVTGAEDDIAAIALIVLVAGLVAVLVARRKAAA